jgi:hypothetical protein
MLQPARGFVNVDAFAGGDAMDGGGGHGFPNRIIAEGPKCGGATGLRAKEPAISFQISDKGKPESETHRRLRKTGEHKEKKERMPSDDIRRRSVAWAY